MNIWRVILGSLVVVIGLVVGLLVVLAVPVSNPAPTEFGVSFSADHAQGIGLNWQEAYQAILYDLGVKRLRLGAYWNQLEPADNQFDFATLDYQMDEAAKAEAKVILTIGRKVQRWPECHEPEWVKSRAESVIREELLEYLAVVVERYRAHPALSMWQLENEPFLQFGACPPGDAIFLAQEEQLVRSLDPAHPILITDSGELNWWVTASRYGDSLGTTMYRTVWSARTERPFSYDYIFPAWLYRAKARAITWLRGSDVLISELQGEPWGEQPFTTMTAAERQALLSPGRLLELRHFAERTQLPEAYWWGVEFWYWEKTINGNARWWETARAFFE